TPKCSPAWLASSWTSGGRRPIRASTPIRRSAIRPATRSPRRREREDSTGSSTLPCATPAGPASSPCGRTRCSRSPRGPSTGSNGPAARSLRSRAFPTSLPPRLLLVLMPPGVRPDGQVVLQLRIAALPARWRLVRRLSPCREFARRHGVQVRAHFAVERLGGELGVDRDRAVVARLRTLRIRLRRPTPFDHALERALEPLAGP